MLLQGLRWARQSTVKAAGYHEPIQVFMDRLHSVPVATNTADQEDDRSWWPTLIDMGVHRMVQPSQHPTNPARVHLMQMVTFIMMPQAAMVSVDPLSCVSLLRSMVLASGRSVLAGVYWHLALTSVNLKPLPRYVVLGVPYGLAWPRHVYDPRFFYVYTVTLLLSTVSRGLTPGIAPAEYI